ncbi:DUF6445 family protein [Sphingomonas sp. TDK1]|uniref:DUF6445 family protein n=1 Tax=Sphingomonas sp. TDK1 TaxID=453247 RepID=UPI0007D9DAD3|nr:DUF6445 family protein [Sphingomonas sp. TDK1]OAN58380.1 hypothetical protein A7X12_04805 [Sphingomonas sp. TDK1]
MILSPVLMGAEQVPLWQRDDAHPASGALAAAAGYLAFEREKDDLYPGLRAPVPDGYADWLVRTASAMLGQDPAFLRGSFAVASDDPARLAPIQRIPHFDDCSDSIVAAVHYLCAAPHGGTSFYRHRATGFERINAERLPLWRQALSRDSQRYGLPPKSYHDGDSPAFERIGQALLAFNRLILYPANCLHAGDVGPFWHMAATGPRLTITSLLACEAGRFSARVHP